MIAAAVESDPAVSLPGVQQRAFSFWFQRLVYNQIWEDPRVDLLAMEVDSSTRIVTIASGGCNALNYLIARPASIDAVDINPAQVALTRLKLAAAAELPDHEALFRFLGRADAAGNANLYHRFIRPVLDPDTLAYWEKAPPWRKPRIAAFTEGFYRHGLLGRFIGFAHWLGRLAGGSPERLFEARTIEDQRRLFDRHIAPAFDHPLFRMGCAIPSMFYSLGIPPQQYAAMRADAERAGYGGDMAKLMRERVRRLACDFPLGANYFAWQAFARRYAADPNGAVPDYLKPEHFGPVHAGAARVRVHLASMTGFLGQQPARSLDRFLLLDSQDWMTRKQLDALWKAIDRAATPGARAVFRTAAADSPLERGERLAGLRRWRRDAITSAALWRLDRSAIYGGLHVYVKE
jgi:S-adenosylmethionine-diacylglycerol 3-amino-3-carboxypropyl transferase